MTTIQTPQFKAPKTNLNLITDAWVAAQGLTAYAATCAAMSDDVLAHHLITNSSAVIKKSGALHKAYRVGLREAVQVRGWSEDAISLATLTWWSDALLRTEEMREAANAKGMRIPALRP